MAQSIALPVIHFNDVYRVSQRYNGGDPAKTGGSQNISAAQFARQLADIRDTWADSPSGEGSKEGLVLFSGDVFAPSVESTITRGSHMVPLLNSLAIDCAQVGNHDFDHSYAHLTKLVGDCKFPWLVSNILDTQTGKTPESLHEYQIFERCGLKVGVVGLVEPDWIATIPSFPSYFKHQPMADRARELSRKLRGEEGCDIIIALTHSRVNNDIALANEIGAIKYKEGETERGDGVDIILGGHDHIYYIGRGCGDETWKDWERPDSIPGTEEDKDCLIVKSGTDFRDLSAFTLDLILNPSYPKLSPRKYLIASVTGKHYEITPETPTSEPVQDLIDGLLKDIGKTLDKPACFTVSEWDCRSEIVRTQESALGNWMADVLLHSYSDALETQGVKTDVVMNCGGTLRGDSRYGPGVVTLGDILEILPFEDSIVVIQMNGRQIWDSLEGALSKYPAQEGRFPIVAGMEVKWDSRKPPGHRVQSVHLVSHHRRRAARMGGKPKPVAERPTDVDESDTEDEEEDESTVRIFPHPQKGGVKVEVQLGGKGTREEIKRQDGGRIYTVVTREYMALGYDGYEAMKGSKFLIDDENGLIMSNIIRHFLLGASFITRKRRIMEEGQAAVAESKDPAASYLSPKTERAIDWNRRGSAFGHADGGTVVKQGWRSVRNALRIARTEHMSEVDKCSGQGLRNFTAPSKPVAERSPPTSPARPARTTSADNLLSSPSRCSLEFFVQDRNREVFHSLEDDIAVVAPFIDGRMRDLARS